MIIAVGSKNQTKIEAVKQTLFLYPHSFPNPKVKAIDVNLKEFGHPQTLEETIEGAMDRAKQAFVDCDFSFGIEGGLMKVPYSQSGYMETGVCVIYDGTNTYLGLSPAFEWPPEVTKIILKGEADASKAFKDLGYTTHEKLGAVKGGIIGVLTNGRVTREDYTKYAIIMALTQLEKPEFFKHG